MSPFQGKTPGAFVRPEGGVSFRVWATAPDAVELLIEGREPIPMTSDHAGHWEVIVPDAAAGTRYRYRLDGTQELPDPASRFQPDGPHGWSQVIDTAFPWSDSGWRGVPLREAVFYEIHVGTFTPEGTFEAIIPRLRDLRELGVTVIEIMPVAQFPGSRNWGYDGTFLYAAQNSYGGPDGFRRLVDAAHREGLGVCLDVVYNHLGPEGNYLEPFAGYFTGKYATPWGRALNFDGADSDGVREYFVGSALMWVRDFHIDALRLDAVHAIIDQSAYPFLQELGERVHAAAAEAGREVLVIAESDLNDPRFVRPIDRGGLGLEAHWNDDFHHALHTLLTRERSGYYLDYGKASHLARVLESGYAYSGDWSPHRRRRHGADATDVAGFQLVAAAQNHDQVGNRMLGERLSTLVGFEELKLAAAALLFSPFLPLLFMGEEWGDPAPFLYFISHTDEDLVEAVRKGRKEEFASFGWKEEPPDPQSEETFRRSRPDPGLREREPHRTLHALYRELLALRRAHSPLGAGEAGATRATADDDLETVIAFRGGDGEAALLAMNFSGAPRAVAIPPGWRGEWTKILDTADDRWRGPGSPAAGSLSGKAAEVSLPPRALAAWVRNTKS